MNILEACKSPHVFAPWFRDPATWEPWFAYLAALFGLPLTEAQADIYHRHTARDALPDGPSRESWLVCGRRAGKSFIMALVAVYLATFRDYRQHLQPGERATVAVIAADRKQARVIMRYARAMLIGIGTFKGMLERETADSFDLTNQVTIEVSTASATSTRGYTYAAVLCDEIARWPTGDDAAENDGDILEALRPGMLTIPGSVLICASSPHARRGEMWEAHRKHYGKAGPLVWQAPTWEMNPRANRAEIDAAYEKDEAWASAEYGAQFRTDIEMLLKLEAVEACIDEGMRERQYMPGVAYKAFTDPSGGSSDSMTLAIAHTEGVKAVVDVLREVKAPYSPDAVVAEYSMVLKQFGLRTVYGDRYAGLWPRERFAAHGIEYMVADRNKSELYLGLVSAMNSGSAALLDDPRMKAQMVALERRTARGGRESIDHPPGGHDDVANAVAGVLDRCLSRRQPSPAMFGTYVNGKIELFGLRRDDDLPLPAWAQNPQTESARRAVEAYRARGRR